MIRKRGTFVQSVLVTVLGAKMEGRSLVLTAGGLQLVLLAEFGGKGES